MTSEEEQIIQMIAQELMAGKSVNEVAAELVQAGVPQSDAYEIVQAVAQEMGGRSQTAAPSARQAPRRHHGHPWLDLFFIILILFLLWLLMKR